MNAEIIVVLTFFALVPVLMVEGFQETKEQSIIFKNAVNVNQTLKQVEARWKIVLDKLLKPEKATVMTKITDDMDYQDGSGQHRIVYDLTYFTNKKKLLSWKDAVKAMGDSLGKSPIPHVRAEDALPGEYNADIVFA